MGDCKYLNLSTPVFFICYLSQHVMLIVRQLGVGY